jgi:hypothetical protein
MAQMLRALPTGEEDTHKVIPHSHDPLISGGYHDITLARQCVTPVASFLPEHLHETDRNPRQPRGRSKNGQGIQRHWESIDPRLIPNPAFFDSVYWNTR